MRIRWVHQSLMNWGTLHFKSVPSLHQRLPVAATIRKLAAVKTDIM